MCWFFTHIIYRINELTNKQRSRNYFKSVSGHVTFSCFSCYTSSLAKKCRVDLFRKDIYFSVVPIQPTENSTCPFRMYWSRSTGRDPLHSVYAVCPVKLALLHTLYMYSEAETAGNCCACVYQCTVCSWGLFISLCICSRSEISILEIQTQFLFFHSGRTLQEEE